MQDLDPCDLERFQPPFEFEEAGVCMPPPGAGRTTSMMAPNLDQEIDLLLEKLNGIQAEVGVAKSEGKEAEESGGGPAVGRCASSTSKA